MGRYNAAVQLAKSYPNNLAAIDFTNWDDVNGFFLNEGNAANPGPGIPINNPLRTTEGVILDGVSQRVKIRLDTLAVKPSSWFLIYRRLDGNGQGWAMDAGTSETGTSQLTGAHIYPDESVYFTFYYDTYTAPAGAVTNDEINLLAVGTRTNYSSNVFFGPVGSHQGVYNNGTPNLVNSSNWWVSLGGTRAGTNHLKCELLFFAMWADEAITPTQIAELGATYNHYGRLLLPTNLDSARHQSHLALGPLREVTSRGFTMPGATDLDIPLPFESGQTVEFMAFDTDADNSVLTTGPVIPSPTETLVFNPVAGSGTSDPGTGLVAHIAGTVNIDGTAAEREVIVISDDPNGRQVLGQGMSAVDGTFDINYNDWGGAVIALALDNYGGDWSAETALTTGTIIHPTTPNGYVYEATVGGTTGTTEPIWTLNSSVNDGSVTFNPRPFYRPIASGPLAGEVLEEGTTPTVHSAIFWRIYITENSAGHTGVTASVFYLAFYSGSNQVIDTTQGTALASSEYGVGNLAQYAFNSNLEEVWAPEDGPLPHWISYEFLTEKTVGKITLETGTNNFYIERMPITFDIQKSNNGTTWETVKSVVGEAPWGASETREYVL